MNLTIRDYDSKKGMKKIYMLLNSDQSHAAVLGTWTEVHSLCPIPLAGWGNVLSGWQSDSGIDKADRPLLIQSLWLIISEQH